MDRDAEDMVKDLTDRGMIDENTKVHVIEIDVEDFIREQEQVFERVYALFTPDEIELLKGVSEAFDVPVATAMRMMVLGYLQISQEMAMVSEME